MAGAVLGEVATHAARTAFAARGDMSASVIVAAAGPPTRSASVSACSLRRTRSSPPGVTPNSRSALCGRTKVLYRNHARSIKVSRSRAAAAAAFSAPADEATCCEEDEEEEDDDEYEDEDEEEDDELEADEGPLARAAAAAAAAAAALAARVAASGKARNSACRK